MNISPIYYPHSEQLEQGVGLHYKPFRLFRLIPSLAIQPLARAIFFYLASNPRSRAKAILARISNRGCLPGPIHDLGFTFGTILEHPASLVHQTISYPHLRRLLMGLAVGLTAITIIYSPWGRQSVAHINPSTTFTFFL